MKIGIISMHRVKNYGSFMQSYALKKAIESLGHDCVFLDIRPGEQIVEPKSSLSKISWICKRLDRNILKRINHFRMERKYNWVFPKVLKDELGVTDVNYNEACDLVIIGSDEVFNCTQPSQYGLSPSLFGQDINTNKVISYAASFGYTTLESLKRYKIDGKICEYLKSFSAISVRDNNSYNIIRELIGIEPEINVDPVLIGDFDDRIVEPDEDDYIAVYSYSNRISNPDEINAIKKFAKDNNLKTIAVGMYQLWCDKNVMGTPFEMVGYIKKAKYVITDTFHGTVFSMKYQKQFVTFIRDSNRNKLLDLLQRFSLEKRSVDSISELPRILLQQYDIEGLIKRIEEEKNKSFLYLENAIKGDFSLSN